MEPLTRSEILQTLSCMGINLPTSTKLSDDALEKRLREGLNASQNRENIPAPLNMSSTRPWPMLKPWDASASSSAQGRPVFNAVRRTSVQEMAEHAQALRAGQRYDPSPLYTNAFMDIRQTMMSIGHALDRGQRWCIIQDTKCETYALNIRFLSVLEIDDRTPAIVLLYRMHTAKDAIEGMQWGQHQYDKDPNSRVEGGISMITATPLEMKLLMKLLSMNAKLLPPDYKPERGPYEEKHKVSVLLPVGPLSFEALGSLNNDTGCAICEKERTSRCSQCQSVSYCGAECQKADWPEHKKACRSLKGGRWCTIPFRTNYADNILADFMSRRSLFLVKIQAGMGTETTMLIYDRNRTFKEVFFFLEDDPETHAAVLAEIRGPRGGYGGLKMYRWAKRTGDRQLSICLDRPPTMPIAW
ncbi:hypothetical protein OH76DRAFT_1467037 [Lentinus brumalis]|uniref:MYND-type domain-containing protein n=1 Tax=Lentinus brumalis TaxID=2498619 RepID=A0A371CNV3_9APHY|nr:hypothetical protein OH76DRAFT_1467037 [Polyporus brumalis]